MRDKKQEEERVIIIVIIVSLSLTKCASHSLHFCVPLNLSAVQISDPAVIFLTGSPDLLIRVQVVLRTDLT